MFRNAWGRYALRVLRFRATSFILLSFSAIQKPMRLHTHENLAKSSDPIGDLLRNAKTIAVVGLSSNPQRPSHEVASYLQSVGYTIIPVNPNETEVLGQKAYSRLEDIPVAVDIVDVFRRSEEVPPVADSAIAIGAKALWLQLGITSVEAVAKAHGAGLLVIEDACLIVEHKRRR
jgi:predicted CoA-binding protein